MSDSERQHDPEKSVRQDLEDWERSKQAIPQGRENLLYLLKQISKRGTAATISLAGGKWVTLAYLVQMPSYEPLLARAGALIPGLGMWLHDVEMLDLLMRMQKRGVSAIVTSESDRWMVREKLEGINFESFQSEGVKIYTGESLDSPSSWSVDFEPYDPSVHAAIEAEAGRAGEVVLPQPVERQLEEEAESEVIDPPTKAILDTYVELLKGGTLRPLSSEESKRRGTNLIDKITVLEERVKATRKGPSAP